MNAPVKAVVSAFSIAVIALWFVDVELRSIGKGAGYAHAEMAMVNGAWSKHIQIGCIAPEIKNFLTVCGSSFEQIGGRKLLMSPGNGRSGRERYLNFISQFLVWIGER